MSPSGRSKTDTPDRAPRRGSPDDRRARGARPAEVTEEPTVEFGDPKTIRIRVWVREARGKRIYARTSIELGEHRVGWVRETVKLKDYAEAFDDSLYRIEFCDRNSLPDAAANAVDGESATEPACDAIWAIANVESPEIPIPERAERFLWLEGQEVFDGFRSIYYTDDDELFIRWRQLPEAEEFVHRLPVKEYTRVVDDFLDWFVDTAKYRLREPSWYRRYSE